MLAEYKKHRWLVQTGSANISSRGWPMMIAEAQAAGVGVCMRNLRPDLRTYVGEGAFLYDSISEVRDIISQPFPEEMRQISFEQAKKSDFKSNRHLLTNLWRNTISSPRQSSVEQLPDEARKPVLAQSLLQRIQRLTAFPKIRGTR